MTSIYDHDYIEADNSPLAKQHVQFFAEQDAKNPTKRFAAYCEANPDAPECKIHDN